MGVEIQMECCMIHKDISIPTGRSSSSIKHIFIPYIR